MTKATNMEKLNLVVNLDHLANLQVLQVNLQVHQVTHINPQQQPPTKATHIPHPLQVIQHIKTQYHIQIVITAL